MDSAATGLPDEMKSAAPPQVVQRNIFRYAFAVVSVALALGVGLLARHYGIQQQYASFLFVIALTAWYCGAGPAIVAVVCSSLAYNYFFQEPFYTLTVRPKDMPDYGLFIVFGLLVGWFGAARRRVEDALRASEKKYRELIDAAPDAIIIWDAQGKCVLSNASAARLRGCSEIELIGLAMADTYVAAERDQVRERLELVKTQGVLRFERRFLRKNGEAIPVEVSLSAAGGDQYQAVLRDISDRKRAEEILRERVSLLDLTHDTIFVRDMQGAVIYWNRGAEALYGWTSQEAIGQIAYELLRKTFPEPFDAINEKLLRTGRWEGEVIHATRDGRRVVVASRLSLQRDERGNPKAILETNNDVTERKKAEEALRRSHEELEIKVKERTAEVRERASLLDLTHDSVFVRNMNDEITYWNRGAEELYGWAPQEAVGRVTHQLLRTLFPEPLDDINATLLRTDRWEGELIHTTRDGTQVVVASRWSLQRDERGNPSAILETNNDVTERKRAEEALRRSRDELQSANKELEAFAYSVSHDLRAPIRHIAGFTQLLQKHAEPVLDDKSRRQISMILDSATRMGSLVDDLLGFSRIGRAETQKTTVVLEELVKGVVSEIAPDTQSRKIVWRIGSLPNCHGDPSMLRLVFANLISNAVKFTRTREPAVIEIGSLNQSPNEIVVFVKDNGVGFNMKYQDKLFGVFQRLHSQEAFEGTGIGLATVQRIVHRHSGRVWGEGTIDHGATFYVALPKPGKANL